MNFSFFQKMSWASYAFSLKRSAQTFLSVSILLIGFSISASAQVEIQIDIVSYTSTSEGSVANLYPNPASSQITVEPEASETITTIEIYTIGMVLITSLNAIDQESFTVTLNTGNYYFRVSNQSETVTKLIQITEE